MSLNWVPILGSFVTKNEKIIFKGEEVEYQSPKGPKKGPSIGNIISNQTFFEGSISADIEFEKIDSETRCEVILFYEPNTPIMINAGLGNDFEMFTIRSYVKNQWENHSISGEGKNLIAKEKYHVEIFAKGSCISLKVNGVMVSSATLPIPLPQGQVGVWCKSQGEIQISNFQIKAEKPKAFVIMQFTQPYDELYEDVIKRVCEDFGLRAVRADETYGPGLIIADIITDIRESHLVIAEISPANPNVYYEVGYSHAVNKPTILIAEKATKLPFDVSPFRTLFYENTIGGKKKIEAGLRKHIQAILGKLPSA